MWNGETVQRVSRIGRGQTLSRGAIFILVLVLSVFIFLTLYKPGGYLAYAVPSVCWILVALATLSICGLRNIRLWLDKQVAVMAALTAIFQIFILMDLGIFIGFGKSPYSFTPRGIMINIIYVLSPLLGMELSRAYLMKHFGRRKPVLTLGLVTLLYSFMITGIIGFLNPQFLEKPLPLAEFLGSKFLPIVTQNLLASYLALLSGPIASMAYRGPLIASEWFSPILPNLSWGFEALLGVMLPAVGFVVINQAAHPSLLTKLGLSTERKRFGRPTKTKAKKSPLRSWTIISIICVLLVWTSTGLLGLYTTVIVSGSMRPTMDVGDVAIVVQTPINEIKPGDVIQYLREGGMISVHRVYDIQETGGEKLFITKGDANSVPDPEPVYPAQIRGKLILTIPKLGWPSIAIKTLIATVWSFLSANVAIAYTALATTFGAGIFYTIHAHKNRPAGHWRRKGGW